MCKNLRSQIHGNSNIGSVSLPIVTLGRDLCCDVASAGTRAAHCELLIVIEASIDTQLLYLRRLWMKR